MRYAEYGLILLELASQCQPAHGRSPWSNSSKSARRATSPPHSTHSDRKSSALHISTVRNASQVVRAADDSAPLLPSTGTGSVYASSCNDAKQSWVQAGGSSLVSTTAFQTSTSSVGVSLSVSTTITTEVPPSATLYTLCDGFPRLSGNISTSYSVVNVATTSWSTFTTTSSVYVKVPAPDCTIQEDDCAALAQAYDLPMTAPPQPSQPPICGRAMLPTSMVDQPLCAEKFASVQVLFWPVTTASDCDLCSLDTCRTTTMSQTIPGQANTFVFHNVTLTSPTVYVALAGTFVYTRSGTLVSRDSELILPQSSTQLSSLCGQLGSKGGQFITRSFNFADFAGPNVPAESYRCQPRCYSNPYSLSYSNETYTFQAYTDPGTTFGAATTTYQVANYDTWATVNQCSTIYDDYRPVLSIPALFSSMAPAVFVENVAGVGGSGAYTCRFIFESDAVFFDPPMALTQAATAASATLPVYASLWTPTAGPDGRYSRPVQTALPENSATWDGPMETGRPLPSSNGGPQQEQGPSAQSQGHTAQDQGSTGGVRQSPTAQGQDPGANRPGTAVVGGGGGGGGGLPSSASSSTTTRLSTGSGATSDPIGSSSTMPGSSSASPRMTLFRGEFWLGFAAMVSLLSMLLL